MSTWSFACDEGLIATLRVLAQRLEAPIYVTCEHALQAGIQELTALCKDEALRELLRRHLVEGHLLVPATEPESEPMSRRALRIRSALNFLALLEALGTREAVSRVVQRLNEELRS